MDSNSPVPILNELLAVEERGLAARVLESTVFISRASVEESTNVRRMANAQRKHRAWLSEALIENGGVPGPRVGDAASGDLHFQDIRCLMPRLAVECEAIIAKFALAADRVSAFPKVAGLISKIHARHLDELAVLKETAQ